MKEWLQSIREPDRKGSLKMKILASVGIAVLGVLLGIFQKWLDSVPINELPLVLQWMDPVNFFGRLAIWILLATVISVFASTPFRAALNSFLFLISMVAGYYVYCRVVLGFLSVSYALIWVAIAFASPFLGYVCWYAKGKGTAAVVLSAVILGVLFAQAVLLWQGIRIAHLMEVIVWVIGLIILRRKPKETAVMVVLSIAVALAYQLLIPYWG